MDRIKQFSELVITAMDVSYDGNLLACAISWKVKDFGYSSDSVSYLTWPVLVDS